MAFSTPPIMVGSTRASVALTLVRYALTALGALVISKGWFSENEVNDIIGLVLLVAPTIWGMVLSRKNNNEKKEMAEKLPDSVAQVK